MTARSLQRLSGPVICLGVFAGLTAWISAVNSPNPDEVAHLPSGISHWEFERFELYRVNPPLIRMIAALPVLPTRAKRDWQAWTVTGRPEFAVGRSFVKANGEQSFWYFTLARWAVIPLVVWGGWVCFLWSRELFGTAGGIVSVVLYSFCPNMLAWSASITPDAGAASLGLVAGYSFWRWLREPDWSSAGLAGLTLGLAELTKTTWIVLFPLWPLIWILWRLQPPARPDSHLNGGRSDETPPESGTSRDNASLSGKHRAAPGGSRQTADVRRSGQLKKPPSGRQLAVILLTGLYLINLGYGFEGSFQRLREFRFVSRTLGGNHEYPGTANRFAESWLGAIPVPLPGNYVLGIDVQRSDFERGKWSYLRGELRKGGWWYYYLYSLAVKTPIGTLLLLGLAMTPLVGRGERDPAWNTRSRSHWTARDVIVVLAPALAVLVLVSSQTGFNRYLRYVLPAVPFLYVLAGRAGLLISRKRPLVSGVIILALSGSVAESLSVYPHSMSFFNQLAGGPLNGHRHLLDASIDWGQDLLFLKKWYDSHPEARPLHVSYYNDFMVNPETAGIDWKPVPEYHAGQTGSGTDQDDQGPRPGWYAVSTNPLYGYRHFDGSRPVCTWLQEFQPVAMAGYSIRIFHVSIEQANALRTRLGLRQLTSPAAASNPPEHSGDLSEENL